MKDLFYDDEEVWVALCDACFWAFGFFGSGLKK